MKNHLVHQVLRSFRIDRRICEMCINIFQIIQVKFFGGKSDQTIGMDVDDERGVRRHHCIQAQIKFVAENQQGIRNVSLDNRLAQIDQIIQTIKQKNSFTSGLIGRFEYPDIALFLWGVRQAVLREWLQRCCLLLFPRRFSFLSICFGSSLFAELS